MADALWWRTIRVTSSSARAGPRWRADGRSSSAGPIVAGLESARSSRARGLQQARFAQQLPRAIGGLGEGIGVEHDQIAGAERQLERLVAGRFVEAQRQVRAVRSPTAFGCEQRPLPSAGPIE